MPQQGPKINTKKETQILLKDLEGQPILSVGLSEYVIKDSNGCIIRKNTNESILLTTGEFWHPGMKNMPVGVCTECRRKKNSHGICSLKMARMCIECGGKLLCPSCRKLGKDYRWRCIKHHRKYMFIKNIIRPVFFSRKEE